jgi:hypothetical protein
MMEPSTMSMRVAYEITNEQGKALVVLSANNSPQAMDTDRLFVEAIREGYTLSDGLASLLECRDGARVFNIDLTPTDHEYVLRARVVSEGEESPEMRHFERVDLDGTVSIVHPYTLEVTRPGATPRQGI